MLAHACRGLVLAGAISALLDRDALPRRDTFAVCDTACGNASEVLRDTLGEHLFRRYSAGARHEDIAAVLSDGPAEPYNATDDDIDTIAAAMTTLGATLKDLTEPIPDDDSLPPDIRRAGQYAADAATILCSHYGGDSGGW